MEYFQQDVKYEIEVTLNDKDLFVTGSGVTSGYYSTSGENFSDLLEELKFSDHSLAREGGKLTLRLKVPYNYSELDDFELKAIELLGIDKNYLIDMSLTNSNCTKDLIKTK